MFFSDIHGNKYVIPTLIKAINAQKPDKIIFCGDIYGYYYYQDEIISFLKAFNVHSILGNHDKYFIDLIDNKISLEYLVSKYGKSYSLNKLKINKDSVSYIRQLKPNFIMKLGKFKLGVFHGSPEDFLHGRVYFDTPLTKESLYNEFDYVILGHTHHKMVRKFGKTIILNPGSIGQQRDGLGCSYLILDSKLETYSFHELNYDKESLKRDILEIEPNNTKLIEVLFRSK